MMEPRKIRYVSFIGPDGPENSFYLSDGVKGIEMRRDGAGPMGFYDVIYVTTNDGMVSGFPAHQCTEFQFAAESENGVLK